MGSPAGIAGRAGRVAPSAGPASSFDRNLAKLEGAHRLVALKTADR